MCSWLHKLFLLSSMLVLGMCVYGQQSIFLRTNLTPLLAGSYELTLEKHLGEISALEIGVGFRSQKLDSGAVPSIQAMRRFRNVSNRAFTGMVGIRFFENTAYEHPFLSLHLTGVSYRDEVLTSTGTREVYSGFQLGALARLGFSFPIGQRLGLDVGMQIGYSPPREPPEPTSYYFPQMGFVVADFNIASVPGGHFMPVFAIRYKIKRSQRERIRDQ